MTVLSASLIVMVGSGGVLLGEVGRGKRTAKLALLVLQNLHRVL